mmetsp:Transcript_14526/g.38468  ORF Transcript_14526/g.38468 Transcript_14526/m.38468 type:complete len:245 (+) Transcript_14526:185-919(+)
MVPGVPHPRSHRGFHGRLPPPSGGRLRSHQRSPRRSRPPDRLPSAATCRTSRRIWLQTPPQPPAHCPALFPKVGGWRRRPPQRPRPKCGLSHPGWWPTSAYSRSSREVDLLHEHLSPPAGWPTPPVRTPPTESLLLHPHQLHHRRLPLLQRRLSLRLRPAQHILFFGFSAAAAEDDAAAAAAAEAPAARDPLRAGWSHGPGRRNPAAAVLLHDLHKLLVLLVRLDLGLVDLCLHAVLCLHTFLL